MDEQINACDNDNDSDNDTDNDTDIYDKMLKIIKNNNLSFNKLNVKKSDEIKKIIKTTYVASAAIPIPKPYTNN